MSSDKIISHISNVIQPNYNSHLNGKNLGFYVDTETTGVENTDEIFELCMIPFYFTDDLEITKVLSAFISHGEPSVPICEEAKRVTGIDPESLKGKKFNVENIHKLTKQAEVIVAHKASFDRFYMEKQFSIENRVWGCSMFDIDWKAKGINSNVLEYIAFRYGFWYDAHEAHNDCLAGIHILAQEENFKELMTNVYEPTFKVILRETKFDEKEILKQVRFKWDDENKYWYKERVSEKEVEKLRHEILPKLSKFEASKIEEDILKRHKN